MEKKELEQIIVSSEVLHTCILQAFAEHYEHKHNPKEACLEKKPYMLPIQDCFRQISAAMLLLSLAGSETKEMHLKKMRNNKPIFYTCCVSSDANSNPLDLRSTVSHLFFLADFRIFLLLSVC